MKRFISLFILSFLILTSTAQFLHSQIQSKTEIISESNNHFAIDLYKEIRSSGGNIFFSPFSISTAFALTSGGARGETAEQIANVFHFPYINNDLHSAYSDIQRILNRVAEQSEIELHIANALWPDSNYPFITDFIQFSETYYRAEITPLDFESNPGLAVRKINSWVEKETNGKIQDIISNPLNPSTRFILTNAIYFKGEWNFKFKRFDTSKESFYVNEDETIKIPMMHLTEGFKYSEDENVQVLEIPYIGDGFAMIVILPKDIEGLENIEEILSVYILNEWNESSHQVLVDLSLPRFKMSYELKLKEILKDLGMPNAFNIYKADFSGLIRNPNQHYINDAVHKSYIEVNEKGTEATAATSVGGCFPAGTKVITSDGLIDIESVELGSRVYSYDLNEDEWMLSKVIERQNYQYEGDIIFIKAGNSTLRATGNHPFFVLNGNCLSIRPLPRDVPILEQEGLNGGRWVEARDLQVGDMLKNKNEDELIITSISSQFEKTEVFNLNIEYNHNYAIAGSGILVHNKGSAEERPIIFNTNHPFIFLIRDNETGCILFIGRMTNPE